MKPETKRGRVRIVAGLGALVLAIVGAWLWREHAATRRAGAGGRGPALSIGQPGARAPGLAATTTRAPLRFAAGRRWIDARWGAALGHIGHRRGEEEAPEGPMSFAVAAGGDLLVLDQVNARVQRFRPDGTPIGAVSIATDTFQDLAVDRDGRIYALDRLADEEVAIFGPDGSPEGRLAVVGGPITEGGEVTGISVGADGVWVEREHLESVRIATAGGQADPARTTRPGRPLRDGSGSIAATLVDAAGGRAAVRRYDHDGRLRWERQVAFPRAVLQLLVLDSDLRGHVFVGAEVGVEDPQPPHDFADLADVVIRLGEVDGAEAGTLILPASEVPEESLRRIVITDDGEVLHLQMTDDGTEIVRYAF